MQSSPSWLQGAVTILAAMGGGALLLEVLKRGLKKIDDREKGNSDVVIRNIDDRAEQRGEWWAEIQRLRERLDTMEQKLEHTRSYCFRLWNYCIGLKQAYIKVASELADLGYEVPDLPEEPPMLDKVWSFAAPTKTGE